MKDILYLDGLYRMGVRDFAPAVSLRLGKDQPCFDFVSWHASVPASKYPEDREDFPCPFSTSRNADICSPAGAISNLTHMVAAVLVKYRALVDVQSIRNSYPIRDRLIPEPYEVVYHHLVGDTLRNNRAIMSRFDHTLLLKSLNSEILHKYEVVTMYNNCICLTCIAGQSRRARPNRWYRDNAYRYF